MHVFYIQLILFHKLYLVFWMYQQAPEGGVGTHGCRNSILRHYSVYSFWDSTYGITTDSCSLCSLSYCWSFFFSCVLSVTFFARPRMDNHILLRLLSGVPSLPSCPPPLLLSSHTCSWAFWHLLASDVWGGGTSNCKYWSVCLFFLYTVDFTLLSPFLVNLASKKGMLLFSSSSLRRRCYLWDLPCSCVVVISRLFLCEPGRWRRPYFSSSFSVGNPLVLWRLSFTLRPPCTCSQQCVRYWAAHGYSKLLLVDLPSKSEVCCPQHKCQ